MNKIDFPIGVELPLGGGGVAVLNEFFDGCWWGRYRTTSRWHGSKWEADGSHVFDFGDLRLLTPKRKAWVAWFREGPMLFTDAENIERQKDIYASVFFQEITEP